MGEARCNVSAMGKAKPVETGSDVRRIGRAVLANVEDYRAKLARKLGVAPDERDVLESAIMLGLAELRRKAGLAQG